VASFMRDNQTIAQIKCQLLKSDNLIWSIIIIMKGTMKISLMPSSGMHSKVFSVSLHILCDLLASPHLLFLNAHSIN
jgi:hypothetical protein